MYKNRGKILQKRVEESKIPKIEIAKQAGIAKKTLYNWFSVPDLQVEKLYKIGKIINHDFDIDLQADVEYIIPKSEIIQANEIKSDYKIDWKSKFYKLLEEHNKLLRDITYINQDVSTILENGFKILAKKIEKAM